MSFLEVIIMCIHPVYASIINAIRRYYAEGDHAAAQKLKSQLPCFTPAGTLTEHMPSKLPPPQPYCRARLRSCKRSSSSHPTLCGRSSHGSGHRKSYRRVKVFAYVEGIETAIVRGQQLVSRYYNQLLGLGVIRPARTKVVCVISVIRPMDMLPVFIRHLCWNHI